MGYSKRPVIGFRFDNDTVSTSLIVHLLPRLGNKVYIQIKCRASLQHLNWDSKLCKSMAPKYAFHIMLQGKKIALLS